MKLDAHKIDKSLKYSLFDGIFASAMMGFIQDYFTPFLLLLGATARQIGMLNALPNFFASLVQLKSADIVDKLRSRRRIIIFFVFLQALMLLPMMLITFYGGTKPLIFINFVIMFASLGAIAVPAWGSLMSDLVAEDKRGEYFGWRNKVLGFVTVAASFTAGYILHEMKKINIFHGFSMLFGCAFIFRMISWYFLKRMYEPALTHHRENYFTLYNFLARIRESNFAKFVLCVSMMSFSVNLCSPFFAVLMLRDLKFSYLLYTLITITATLTTLLMTSRWGRHADRVGNIKIIRFTAPLIGIIPLLWIINHHPVFLFFAQIFSGFVWAGFNLCASNFIFDAVTPEKRTRCIAYFNVLNGVSLSIGALLGGFLIQRLPLLFGNKILTLLLISSVLRTVVGLMMPLKLKEVRPTEKIRSNQLFFSVIGLKPLLDMEREPIK